MRRAEGEVSGKAHHNVGESRCKASVAEGTALSGNAHQLQLLLRVAATQVQLHPTKEQAVLIIQPAGRYGAWRMH